MEITARNTTIEIQPPDSEKTQPQTPYPYRLEHLSPEEGNTPAGRGTETAGPRGYDTERLVSKIYDGKRDDRESWYDVEVPQVQTDPQTTRRMLIECKSCIDEHPSGKTGTFKIWRKHHERLVDAGDVYSDEPAHTRYVFLIYTVVDDQAIEIGKFEVNSRWVDHILGEWQFGYHDTMGTEFYQTITWTKLLKELNLSLNALRRTEVASPDPADAPEGFWEV